MLVSAAITLRRFVRRSKSRAKNSSWLGMCVISCMWKPTLSAGDPGRCLPADPGRLLCSGLLFSYPDARFVRIDIQLDFKKLLFFLAIRAIKPDVVLAFHKGVLVRVCFPWQRDDSEPQ